MKIAGLVEYDGTEFAGWAVQPDRRTVEGTLVEALGTVLRQPVKLSVAGRTDAGVHASCQVVSFEADTELPPAAISYKTTALLPKDLALRRCVSTPEDFDARWDARYRSYEYRILNDETRSPLQRHGTSFIARPLDFEVLQQSAGLVSGIHVFQAFTPSNSYHNRFEREVLGSRWTRSGDLLTYHITANSFLYGMVRALVGTMLEVSDGKRTLADFERLLSGGERSEAGPSAPGRGLTLTNVAYDHDLWGERP